MGVKIVVSMLVIGYFYAIWLFLKSIGGNATNEKDDDQQLPQIENMSIEQYNDFFDNY